MAWNSNSTCAPDRREGFDSGLIPATRQISVATAGLTRENSEVSMPRRFRARVSFTRRQRELIDRLYGKERPHDLAPEEQIIADLIGNDRGGNGGLQSFIRNMFAVIEFDAYRKGRLVSEQELVWYSNCLARSVVDDDATRRETTTEEPAAGRPAPALRPLG